MKTNLTLYALVGLSLLVARAIEAAPLQSSDPEHSQLVAMGYEISSTETGSIAERGNKRMWVSKDDEYTFVSRTFSVDAKKVERNELKTLQVINKLNSDLAYVLAISEDKQSLICGHYYRGAYERKSFAETISEIEACNIIFNLQPSLLELGGQ
jgi:hypothetical protein